MNNTQTKTRLLVIGLCASVVLNVALLLSPSSALRAGAADHAPVAQAKPISTPYSVPKANVEMSDAQLLAKFKRDEQTILRSEKTSGTKHPYTNRAFLFDLDYLRSKPSENKMSATQPSAPTPHSANLKSAP